MSPEGQKNGIGKAKSIIAIIVCPIGAIEAAKRLTQVRLGVASPPPGWNIEDFAKLSIGQALIATGRSNGVTRECWSRRDQERMAQGKKPKDVPLHPNI